MPFFLSSCRDRWGDAAIDDYLPNLASNAMSTQYSAPSTRANSEASLSRSRDRVDFMPLKPKNNQNSNTTTAKYKSDKVIKQLQFTNGESNGEMKKSTLKSALIEDQKIGHKVAPRECPNYRNTQI